MAAATGTGTPAAESDFVCRAAEGTTTTTTKRLMPNSSRMASRKESLMLAVVVQVRVWVAAGMGGGVQGVAVVV